MPAKEDPTDMSKPDLAFVAAALRGKNVLVVVKDPPAGHRFLGELIKHGNHTKNSSTRPGQYASMIVSYPSGGQVKIETMSKRKLRGIRASLIVCDDVINSDDVDTK